MSIMREVIDRDSLLIVWGYLTWEDKLRLRQCDDRLLKEEIHIHDVKTCRNKVINKSHEHWIHTELYKQVEDIHNCCHHTEIREAARVYNKHACIDYNTVRLYTGKYKGEKLNFMTNFSYLETLLHHQRDNKQYTEIHEYLCSLIENRPDVISFGKYKGRRYEHLPIDYRQWLLSGNSSCVDSEAVFNSFKRRRQML